jgi:ABC-2 type transport system ATP-binding protein
MGGVAVASEGLEKRFGAVVALRGVDLEIEAGTVFALLGNNGAGKTTLVRILATVLRPDGGEARVAGWSVTTQQTLVRAAIGLTGQYVAVDEDLTARENLVVIGRLGHVARRVARSRADELLARLGLDGDADRQVGGYSGGMRRRLDLAASLMTRPLVLFLDEPTTGLDPGSRLALWELVDRLRADGTTVVLTTQYLEEADQLADRICILDDGRVIAEGSGPELKRGHGGEVIEITLARPADTSRALQIAARHLAVPTNQLGFDADRATLVLPGDRGLGPLAHMLNEFDAEAIGVLTASLRQPTLDEVFVRLTGHEDAPDHRLARA